MLEFKHDNYTLKAVEMVCSGKSLFITGKAGTGKTMLLKEIVKLVKARGKQVAITSFTGVAAKNAEGVTLHHLLRIPIGLYLPGHKILNLYSLKPNQEEVVRKLDLLIIDEISMVRCDLMDEVDDILRHYRSNNLPFGGIQIVLFGDLRQLMPVATEDDLKYLDLHYDSTFFFDSNVIHRMNLPVLELEKVHRQSDDKFVGVLNRIREGIFTDEDQNLLRERVKRVKPEEYPEIIRLTTHRKTAWAINNCRLEKQRGKAKTYSAKIEGDVPWFDRPNDKELKLKEGARVMFVANDSTGDYCNGTLGTVTYLDSDFIKVETDEGHEIDVEPYVWEYYGYRIDKKRKEIERYKVGSFKQFPIKLAWAITVHKSQGLTFDKAILSISKAFTPGQVYVALSRCRSLKGIILTSPIKKDAVATDENVDRYLNTATKIVPEGFCFRFNFEDAYEGLIKKFAPNSQERKIIECLCKHGRQTAREISTKTGIIKSDINSKLYGTLSCTGALIHSGNYWLLSE